jgi:nitrogen fixation protein NifB
MSSPAIQNGDRHPGFARALPVLNAADAPRPEPGAESIGRQDRFRHLVRRHPCLSGEGHHKSGRVHLPVSPACNIQCGYCKRSLNKHENRPGVASGLLAPEEAAGKVRQALELCPEISVVGIAGPGDTLATDHAIRTFQLVHREFPDLIKCLSTNGLMLPRRAEEIVAAGVQTVTVTVNAVDPEILRSICAGIVIDGVRLGGLEAAWMLIDAQMKGISRLVGLDVLVKINTVLIPGINDAHVEDIARTVKALGASMVNLIPLIPQHEMAHFHVPTCSELSLARERVERHLPVFRHCKQCRADACGIPGTANDLGQRLFGQSAGSTFSHG